MEKEESHLCVMGSCCVKQELTEEDIQFLKMHTRFDILVPFYNSEVVDPVGVAQKLPRISTIIVCWFSAEWLSEGMTRSKIPQSFITPYYPSL